MSKRKLTQVQHYYDSEDYADFNFLSNDDSEDNYSYIKDKRKKLSLMVKPQHPSLPVAIGPEPQSRYPCAM